MWSFETQQALEHYAFTLVELVALAGDRRVYGFNALVMGKLKAQHGNLKKGQNQ